jgi:hypothetical protein
MEKRRRRGVPAPELSLAGDPPSPPKGSSVEEKPSQQVACRFKLDQLRWIDAEVERMRQTVSSANRSDVLRELVIRAMRQSQQPKKPNRKR